MDDPIQQELIKRTKIELLSELLESIIEPVSGETDRFPNTKQEFIECKAMFRDQILEKLEGILDEKTATEIYTNIRAKYPRATV